MAGNHPGNAAYVSADGKVSFDRYGRKLDSIGNVVAGDRQRAGDAGASPIQRKEEQPKGPPAQPTAAGYTFPANATGLPVARSAWDKSVVQPAVGAASAAGSVGAGRGNNQNVLAPGGIDPSTGRPYPTALNGGLNVAPPSSGTAWRQPWMGPQQAPGEIQMQTGGLNVAPTSSAADFMAGRNPYSPVQPKVNIPGFGQLPASIQMQTGGAAAPSQPWRTPAANMPYPPTGASRGNQYIPETYTQPNVPVYDPRQLTWGVP